MSFNKDTRNLLAKTVTACRRRLTEDVTDQLTGVFGLHPDGTVLALKEMTHLSPDQASSAGRLRDLLAHYTAGAAGKEKDRRKSAYERMTLEISFTILNRLAALRLCEERELVIECVRRGTASDGFRLFERVSGGALGGRYDTYRVFLECLFDELALDLGVLFDRMTPQSAVFPTERCMEDVLAELNKSELTHLWTEDETIGWVYQYFNPPEERKAMRDASAAPRNSRELAVRNQFFTPRYVVEFLTDNTLGRIWYEMRKGETALRDDCRYLVRRPSEVFLAAGEQAPAEPENETDLSQEGLLKKIVYIEHRPKKDPRDLRVLDPACGSGHFLLYTFDLLERIYEEAWEDTESPKSEIIGRTIRRDFESLDNLRRAVPKLIIEHNLHGVDIDPRAVQIAALALWLRAQKTWKNLNIKAAERPQVTKSNIVTAEPMPGEEDMKEEFTAGLKPRVLGQLVDAVFEKMKLAGEAGSLLKIEEEIKDAVAKAKEEYRKELRQRKKEAGYLPGMAPAREPTLFDFTDMSDQDFLDQAEDGILEALKKYAEQAENGNTVRRRLFADDAARGFAFIDLFRKRYDVALMNPPFGLAPRGVFDIHKKLYADSYVELYAQMVTRGAELLNKEGRLGAISSRSFMTISRLRHYRRKLIVPQIALLADLGASVMDDAFVESAAYVISRRSDADILAIDLREAVEPQPKLSESIIILTDSKRITDWVIKKRQLITDLPDGKLLYSLPIRVHKLLGNHNVLEPDVATVRQGMGTFNDFRFLRLRHEVSVFEIERDSWEPLAKGGAFSFYYSDIHLLLNWKSDGAELSAVNISRNGQDAQVRQASEYWRRSGSTYSKRSQKGFSARALPAECIIAGKGPAILSQSNVSEAYLLGWVNSRLIRWIIEIQANDHEYNTGIVKKVPWIEGDSSDHALTKRIKETVQKLQLARAIRDTNSCFIPILSADSLKASLEKWNRIIKDAEVSLSQVMADWDTFIDQLYGVDSKNLQPNDEDEDSSDKGEIEDQEDSLTLSSESAGNAIVILLGFVFGRWDVRIAMDPSLGPKLPDPFDPLPVCPPGMLVRPDGLPAEPSHIVSEEWLRNRPDANTLPPEGAVKKPTIPDSDYPLRINWDGVLVDDPGFNGGQPHRDDIVRRVREVLDLIWKDKAHEIEQEACDILGVSDLRDYFRKPAKFFQDHLKRYSKSRRKAPIYWPLSTASGSYTIWLYYHRLTDQILYAAVNKYVEPKISEVERGLTRIEDDLKAASGREATELRDQLNETKTFLGELRDLREELIRIAELPYKPNLNDGVIINAAPLHNLFRLRKWANDTKKVWDKLEKGDYDWAHLAYIIWPERVREICKKDRSIAIAHGLEDICEVEAPAAKKKGGRGRRKKEAAR